MGHLPLTPGILSLIYRGMVEWMLLRMLQMVV